MSARAPAMTTLLALGALGVVNLGRGSIHAFLPDGGLETIGGFDLSGARQALLFFIGSIGAGQIVSGLLDLWVVVRARAFAATLLAFEALRTAAQIAEQQFVKPAPNDFPGEQFAFAVLAVLLAALAWEALRPRRA